MAIKNIPSLPAKDIVPKGSNKLISKHKFRENINYERYFKYLSSDENYTEFSFFDSRIVNITYGKFDNNGNLVDLNNDFIKLISNNIYALSFVADAFMNLQFKVNLLVKNNTFIDTIYANFEAKSGFKNINSDYVEHMTEIYKTFIEYNSEKRNKIYNFNDFLKHFTLHLRSVCDKVPFLRSSFIKSSKCNVNSTGFAIEFDTIKKDLDEEKYIKYFTSPDFYNFTKLCEAHGFSVDKYCPWRIVFNLENPNSSKYLETYKLNKASVFDTYFGKTLDYDINNLINYILIFYNSYINSLEIDNNEKLYEGQLTVEQIKSRYSDEFWHHLYFYILFLENNIDLNQKQYEQYTKKLTSLAFNKNLNSAYIEFYNIKKNHTKNNTKNFLFTF